jgi:type III pantothenate kinase
VILCLDVGNSQMTCGVFAGEELKLQFRRSTQGKPASDELGVFLRGTLRENDIEPGSVSSIAVCSVVPDLVHSLRAACLKYFAREPFVLRAGVRTGLKIRYRDPRQVGADRIAVAIAAAQRYPSSDVVVVNLGTATTVEVISASKEYLGGAILPGLRLSMQALETGTARLPSVEILRPEHAVGRSTTECIQAGLYLGTLGAIRLLVKRVADEAFGGARPILIGTGGFSALYREEPDFDAVIPDLALRGLRIALDLNSD